MSPSRLLRSAAIDAQAARLFQESCHTLHRRTDRLFASILLLQWLAGMAAACWLSPQTWSGGVARTHPHVWLAVFLGGAIASLPAFLAWKQPGRTLTRHVIAIAQMIFSALLIHLTGGRVETHFHIFGSLAFLACYRDWRVLVTASLVTAVDHFARGLFWPQSIFGVIESSSWRWLEHTGWVLFEDTFLLISMRQGIREMQEVANRRARLETLNAEFEDQVMERTAALGLAHQKLLETSRLAGMAEVATAVLHNVGNVLNSVNVSATVLIDQARESKVVNLIKIGAMLRDHAGSMTAFLADDPKGRRIPGYLVSLADQVTAERSVTHAELDQLRKNIEHIKEIVAMQQQHAKAPGVAETVLVSELVEDALRMNVGAMAAPGFTWVREFEPGVTTAVERHKVLQVLVNLIQNAKQACEESGRSDPQVILRVTRAGAAVAVGVRDNGVGIAAENLTRIFAHGFTTKKNGHGFGLHSGALAAKELGGSLTAQSAGVGRGATFTLELPFQSAAQP
jgi:signal transduction histidine kinase